MEFDPYYQAQSHHNYNQFTPNFNHWKLSCTETQRLLHWRTSKATQNNGKLPYHRKQKPKEFSDG